MHLGPLIVSELSFTYPLHARVLSKQRLLQAVSLHVAAGEMVHIQGQNGSGKTSLLKLLAGLLRPDAGTITYAGQDIWSDIVGYQQKICYLGHKNGVNPNLTVREHCQLDWPAAPEIDQSIKDLALWSVKDRLYSLLSAGQKRRVALLRLCLSSAQLWLLDEPLVSLDAEGAAWLSSALHQHTAKGGQVLYSSHHSLAGHTPNQRVYAL